MSIYRIADTTGDLGISEDTFPSKDIAKLARNSLNELHNGQAKTPDGKPRFVICRAVNHPRGATDGFDHTFKPTKWL